MCGRFGLFARLNAIQDYFGAEFTYDYEPRYNIAPEDPKGIASIQNESPDEINRLQWGIIPGWVDDLDDWPAPTNARAETVGEKRAFRDAFAKRRCLIPANNFYEWTGARGSRRPFYIGVEERELFAMAGIYEQWSDNGGDIVSTSIITCDANDTVSKLHDRMPVMLEPDEQQTWLESDNENELQALLDPFPDEQTRSYEVGKAVNNPTYDAPELVDPLDTEQSGLGEFGS